MTTLPVGAHIVGRVPLAGPEDVFRALSEHAGPLLRRMPDGETETNWIASQLGVLAASPHLEQVEEVAVMLVPFSLREGVDADDLELPELGYARTALASFEILTRLKEEGVVRDDVRLQVNMPSPTTVTWALIAPGSRAAVEPAYERAILREVETLLAGIPHDQLTIGFDIPTETVAMVGGPEEAWYEEDSVQSGTIVRLKRLAAAIPSDVPLGIHICLGSRNNEHAFVPDDIGVQAAFMGRLATELGRPVQWIHVPVPREATDVDAYLAPFADLRLPDATEVFLGVVAIEDGLEATQRRIAAAQKVLPRFGVATVCGLAGEFYPRDAVLELLDLHTQVAAPVV